MESLPLVHIYSDGGANPNPGPGGYGVILFYKGNKKELSEGYKITTNNRMELRGAIEGLKSLKIKSEVILTTDSSYVVNGIEKGWAKKWKANNWIREKNKKAINHDLWAELLELCEKHKVKFEWIKGHAGHEENERCDSLATLAMTKNELKNDKGFDPVEISSNQKEQTKLDINDEKVGQECRKCNEELVKKIPKHTKKTLEKEYFYAYYHHCPGCKTNYMLEEAKRDIKDLVL